MQALDTFPRYHVVFISVIVVKLLFCGRERFKLGQTPEELTGTVGYSIERKERG